MKYGIICNNNSAIVLPISGLKTHVFLQQGENMASLPLSNVSSGDIELEVAPEKLLVVNAMTVDTALSIAAGLVCSTGNGVITYFETKNKKEGSLYTTIEKKVYHVDNYACYTQINTLDDGSDFFDNEPLTL